MEENVKGMLLQVCWIHTIKNSWHSGGSIYYQSDATVAVSDCNVEMFASLLQSCFDVRYSHISHSLIRELHQNRWSLSNNEPFFLVFLSYNFAKGLFVFEGLLGGAITWSFASMCIFIAGDLLNFLIEVSKRSDVNRACLICVCVCVCVYTVLILYILTQK